MGATIVKVGVRSSDGFLLFYRSPRRGFVLLTVAVDRVFQSLTGPLRFYYAALGPRLTVGQLA